MSGGIYRASRGLEDPPPQAEPGVLHVIGAPGREWCVFFFCPCGCGEALQLSLMKSSRPRWTLSGTDAAPTLSPSVSKLFGCKSHFFLRDGKIIWC